MKILKTLMATEGSGKIEKIDTIEYEGRLWLVPYWLDMPSEGVTMPARLVLLDNLPHQKMGEGWMDTDFVLNNPIPKSVLDGQIPPEQAEQFVVVERPPIRIRGGSGLH